MEPENIKIDVPPTRNVLLRRKKLYMVAFLLVVVTFLVVGLTVGKNSQHRLTQASSILQTMKASPGIRIDVNLTGDAVVYGDSQIVTISALPVEDQGQLSFMLMATTSELGITQYTYKVAHNRGFYTLHALEDGEKGPLLDQACLWNQNVPPIDDIIESIINAKILPNDDLELKNALNCQKGQIMHVSWVGHDYHACVVSTDSNDVQVSSIIGHDFSAAVTYMTTEEAQATKEMLRDIPKEIQEFNSTQACPKLDLARTSRSRRLHGHRHRKLYQSPDVDVSSLGLTSEFYNLGLKLGVGWCCIKSALGTYAYSMDYVFRRRKLVSGTTNNTAISITFPRPCVMVHGIGFPKQSPSLVTSYTEAWGNAQQKSPCYCSSMKFVQLDTASRPWYDKTLQSETCQRIMQASFDTKEIAHVNVFTHFTAGLTLGTALKNKVCILGNSSRWVTMQVPTQGVKQGPLSSPDACKYKGTINQYMSQILAYLQQLDAQGKRRLKNKPPPSTPPPGQSYTSDFLGLLKLFPSDIQCQTKNYTEAPLNTISMTSLSANPILKQQFDAAYSMLSTRVDASICAGSDAAQTGLLNLASRFIKDIKMIDTSIPSDGVVAVTSCSSTGPKRRLAPFSNVATSPFYINSAMGHEDYRFVYDSETLLNGYATWLKNARQPDRNAKK